MNSFIPKAKTYNKGPYIHFFKSWLQSSLGKFFNKQKFEQSKCISNKMLYEDDSARYEILSWNRFFWNNFGFNCFSIFAYVNIFFLSLHQQEHKMSKSQQQNVVWRRLALLWNLWSITFLSNTFSFDCVNIFAHISIIPIWLCQRQMT